MLYERSKPNPAGYRDADPADVAGVRGVRLVDVREPAELAGELGRIAGATNVPLGEIEHFAKKWNPAEELVVVCRSGGRSGRAAALLAKQGFRVVNLRGGMIAWNEAGLPVER